VAGVGGILFAGSEPNDEASRVRPSLTTRRLLAALAAILGSSLLAVSLDSGVGAGTGTLPERLAAKDLWTLTTDLSEPNGFFRSDNLLSNEILFQRVIPELVRTAKTGRVYLGVGPEQNFTYIAALRPAMVFIVDVRRGNLQLHLMYKALFELSADRVEFVSRLFSRKRPEGLGPKSTVQGIFTAYANIDQSELLFKANLQAIQDHLLKTRELKLADEDLKGIEYVYYQFYSYGPGIQYWSSGGRGGRNAPTYADLMSADDGKGQSYSFLASEDNFEFLKDLESRNMLVPVVGNFAGPKALRGVGKYLKEHAGVVSAFYLSNVEQYLGREGVWGQFCSNVATLPLDATSTFIRSVRNGNYMAGIGLDSELGNMETEVKACGTVGWFSHLGALFAGRYVPPSARSGR
jgi:hypothetical protein